MIYRRWTLMTAPPVIIGGIVVTLAIGNFIFMENDPLLGPILGPYLKPGTYGPPKKKQEEPTTSTK